MGWNRQKSVQAGKSWERKNEWEGSSTPRMRSWGTQPSVGTKGVPITRTSEEREQTLHMNISGGPLIREEFLRWNSAKKDGSTQTLQAQMQSQFGLHKNQVPNSLAIKRKGNNIMLFNTFYREWRLHKPLCLLDIRFNFLYYWEMGDLELSQAWIDIIGCTFIKGNQYK